MIVASAIAWDQAQADGRRWVRERHTDDGGAQHLVDYLAEPGADAGGIMAGRVALLEADLAAEGEDRAEAGRLETMAAAKDAFFGAMTDAEIRTTLKLPADFVMPGGVPSHDIPKDG